MEKKETVFTWEHAKIAMVIAIMAPPVAFVFSFFYDWGLLRVFGISYSDAPTSLTDHMRTGLVWLPTAIMTIAIAIIVELLVIRLEGGRTKEEILKQPANPSKLRWIINSPYIFIGVMGLIAVILWILLGDIYFSQSLFFGLTVCWIILSIWILYHQTFYSRYSKMFKVLFVAWPLIPLIFFYHGQQAAASELKKGGPSHQIQIVDETGTSYMDARIIRAYGDWLLVITKPEQPDPSRILWLKLDRVEQIRILEREVFPGLLCIASERFCPQPLQN